MLPVIDYETGRFGRPCILLLGYFDGVHVGHRRLISRAKEEGAARGLPVGIMTFYGGKNGGQIFDFDERLFLFRSLGLDFVCAARFDGAFRATDGEAFLEHLRTALGVRLFVCGEDYTYGRGAAGNADSLRRYASSHGAEALVLPLVNAGGEKAATSRAKQLLGSGDMAALAELLGGRYFVRGRVSTEGRHVGRRIGYPTANLHLPPEKYPPATGVYAVTVAAEGALYRGIANYGARPTFGDEQVVLEVYVDGYRGDLYGQELIVYFDFRIRGVRKFDSAAQLSEQLQKDLEKIR